MSGNYSIKELLKRASDEEVICPICKNNEWLECKTPVASMPVDENYSPCNGDIVVCVNMTCTKCGFTPHFNTDVLGIKIINK